MRRSSSSEEPLDALTPRLSATAPPLRTAPAASVPSHAAREALLRRAEAAVRLSSAEPAETGRGPGDAGPLREEEEEPVSPECPIYASDVTTADASFHSFLVRVQLKRLTPPLSCLSADTLPRSRPR